MHLLCKGQGKPVGNRSLIKQYVNHTYFSHVIYFTVHCFSAWVFFIHRLNHTAIVVYSHIGCPDRSLFRHLVSCPRKCCSTDEGEELTEKCIIYSGFCLILFYYVCNIKFIQEIETKINERLNIVLQKMIWFSFKTNHAVDFSLIMYSQLRNQGEVIRELLLLL